MSSYLDRITCLVEELAGPAGPLAPGRHVATETDPQAVIGHVHQYLFTTCGFAPPAAGRSGLPPATVVDHPGVWEDARAGYLHELLIRKTGHPAALAILAADVMQQLLARGAVTFAVRVDPAGFTGLPGLSHLPGLDRDSLLSPAGDAVLNTCSADALAELLTHLKRAYWPFSWDTRVDDGDGRGSHGGFRSVA